MQAYTQIMHQTHTHKAVPGTLKPKSHFLVKRQSEYLKHFLIFMTPCLVNWCWPTVIVQFCLLEKVRPTCMIIMKWKSFFSFSGILEMCMTLACHALAMDWWQFRRVYHLVMDHVFQVETLVTYHRINQKGVSHSER